MKTGLRKKIGKLFPKRIRGHLSVYTRKEFWHSSPDPRLARFFRLRRRAFEARRKKGLRTIPIFIISFNRLSYVKQMVEQLERLGLQNIIIVDNASTYPPLLAYLETTRHKVIRLTKNWGFRVLWEAPGFEKYRRNFYVVTDPDLDLSSCPPDVMEVLFRALERFPFIRKAGLSLRLDDIPEDAFAYKEILAWESRFYEVYLKRAQVYAAVVDTTFALYPPDFLVQTESFVSAVRTPAPYQARHLPWYKNDANVTEEDIFYSRARTNGSWDAVTKHTQFEEEAKSGVTKNAGKSDI